MNTEELIKQIRGLGADVPPILHLNGTSERMLSDGYEAAAHAVRLATEALGRVEFNPRDYYPEPGRWEKARERRELAFAMLRRVEADLMDCLRSVSRQGAAIRAMRGQPDPDAPLPTVTGGLPPSMKEKRP